MDDGLERISRLICDVGGIPSLDPGQDFYEAGVSSVASLQLVMQLESDWGVSIPDEEFVAARTPLAVHALVGRLSREQRA